MNNKEDRMKLSIEAFLNDADGAWHEDEFRIGSKELMGLCSEVYKSGELSAALAAQRAGVPDGWKLVPIEPTPEMLNHAWNSGCIGGVDDHKETYMTMLAATPPAPADSDCVLDHLGSPCNQGSQSCSNEDHHPAGDARNEALEKAINTILWLQRRLPKGYDENNIPHVNRALQGIEAAMREKGGAK